jgi:hypothetical protein
MERQLRVQNILTRWASHETKPAPQPDEAVHRSTKPDAPMQMLLRFTTEDGPRTIIASGVPLRVASAITLEMLRAGHFAEYADDRPRLAMALWARGQKNKAGAQPRALLKLAAGRILEAAS